MHVDGSDQAGGPFRIWSPSAKQRTTRQPCRVSGRVVQQGEARLQLETLTHCDLSRAQTP